jgi:hypothetical protein
MADRNTGPWFRAHLDDVGESYLAHARVALGLAGRCLGTAALPLVHALFPWWCVRSGSERIRAMAALVERRDRPDPGR